MPRQHNADTTDDTVQTWLRTGIERGWCSHTYCDMHEIAPMTPDELAQYDDGLEPCLIAVRIHIDTPQEH